MTVSEKVKGMEERNKPFQLPEEEDLPEKSDRIKIQPKNLGDDTMTTGHINTRPLNNPPDQSFQKSSKPASSIVSKQSSPNTSVIKNQDKSPLKEPSKPTSEKPSF